MADRSGWSRDAQEAAEAEHRSDRPLQRERPRLLDRPVGYVSVRWLFVLLGMIVGGILGGVVGIVVTPPGEPGDDFFSERGIAVFLLVPTGALLGGLVTGAILLLERLSAKSER